MKGTFITVYMVVTMIRDVLEKPSNDFPAHEVAVLNHIGRINVDDVICDKDSGEPITRSFNEVDEYMRLCRRYGEDVVSAALGPQRPGLLRDAAAQMEDMVIGTMESGFTDEEQEQIDRLEKERQARHERFKQAGQKLARAQHKQSDSGLLTSDDELESDVVTEDDVDSDINGGASAVNEALGMSGADSELDDVGDPDSESEGPEPEVVTEGDSDSDSEAGQQPEPEPESESEAKPEGDGEAKAEPQAQPAAKKAPTRQRKTAAKKTS